MINQATVQKKGLVNLGSVNLMERVNVSNSTEVNTFACISPNILPLSAKQIEALFIEFLCRNLDKRENRMLLECS